MAPPRPLPRVRLLVLVQGGRGPEGATTLRAQKGAIASVGTDVAQQVGLLGEAAWAVATR